MKTTTPFSNPKQNQIILRRIFILMFLTCVPYRTDLCSDHPVLPTGKARTHSDSSNIPTSLQALSLDGHFSFQNNHHAAKDFGNRYHLPPSAVLHPKSVSDISSTIRHVFQLGSATELTVAARGHGHSLHGQAQAYRGIVVNMRSLQQPKKMLVVMGEKPYVDVSAGELWINILHETLKHGLAPKSWTDYLHLTVGGTLSNAGISGQAFRHGPQIDNVYQLEVVTGKGDVIICSGKQNSDIFYGVLGGLGQFGIITRAKISLEPAPRKVKWIRVLYSDFYKFSKDQEHLILLEQSFDYIEGFVIINRTGLVNNWRPSFNPRHPIQASKFKSDGKTLYCLEVAKYVYTDDNDDVNQNIDSLLSELSYIPSTLFLTETSYIDFLDRVHISEIKLREKGLWDVLHPWLILLIPKSSIYDFAEEVFGNILTDTRSGPILIYPVDKSKWNNKTSLVTPEEDIMFNVGFLSSAVPSSKGRDALEHILARNTRILDFCKNAQLGIKQYLPHYSNQEEWKAHFGPRWEAFVRRKRAYDPLGILAPGHRIFQRQGHYLEACSNDQPCNDLPVRA